jgi:hypothetical protein
MNALDRLLHRVAAWPELRIQHGLFTLFTVAAVFGINPYLYGLYNHCVTIPFVYDAAQPELYPGDDMVAQLAYFYTYFLSGLGVLYRSTGWPLEWIFFGLHLASIYATFWSFYYLARTLTRCRAISVVACLLLLFGSKTLGYVGTLESHLMERTLIMPLEFLALAWVFQGRWIRAFAAIGIAFCIHPLSAFYVGVYAGVAGLFRLWQSWRQQALSASGEAPSSSATPRKLQQELLRFGLGLLVGALAATPSLYLKATGPEPLMPVGTPVEGWLDVLTIRSAYHVFPFDWPWHGWLRAGLFWWAVWMLRAAWKPGHRASPDQASSSRLSAEAWQSLRGMGWAFAGMALLGVVFTEFWPMSIVVQFQFFRAYRFLMYLGMVLLAAGWYGAARGRIPMRTGILAFALAMPAWLEMVELKYATLLMTMVLLWFATAYGMRRWDWGLARVIGLALAFPLMVTPASMVLRGFSIYSHQEPDWVAVQHWAVQHSPEDAGFIVPPNRKGFRVDSKRHTFVDWNDGTQSFFNQAFAGDWIAEMTMVGFNGDPDAMGSGYRSLAPRQFQVVADSMPENPMVYAVVFPDMELPFDEVFANEGYRVLRIR